MLIPAVDILGGKPVQLLRGEYDRATEYGDSPLEAALRWRAAGATRLHVVDLDGARSGRPVNTEAVRRIIAESGMAVQVGGGLRTRTSVDQVLASGAAYAVLGTAAVNDPELLRSVCADHPDKIIVALDTRGGVAATEGWLRSSGRGVEEVARDAESAGAAAILYTIIERDGGLGGPDVEAVAALQALVGVPVIASGGVGSERNLSDLEAAGVHAVIVGTALYEGRVPISAIRQYSEATSTR